MRIFAKKYENEKTEADVYCNEGVDLDASLHEFYNTIDKLQSEDSYEPIPEKIDTLPSYLALVIAFSRIYKIDITVEAAVCGVTVKLCFNDCAMPEGMTRTLGRIITTSDSMCIWTKVRGQEYDCVISLDFNTHRLKIQSDEK